MIGHVRSLPFLLLGILAIIGMGNSASAQARSFGQGAIDKLDRVMDGAFALELTPGAVVVAGRGDGILFQKAYGRMMYDPASSPMKVDTVFDMASCSKSIGCATSIMILADRGKLSISDPVSKFLPGMNADDKKSITIEQCLLHTAGFVADKERADYGIGREEA